MGKRYFAPAACLWTHHVSDIPSQLSSVFLHFQSCLPFFFLVALFLVPACLTLYIDHHIVYFLFSFPVCRGIHCTLLILKLRMNEWYSHKAVEVFAVLSLLLLLRVSVKVSSVSEYLWLMYNWFSIGQAHMTLKSRLLNVFLGSPWTPCQIYAFHNQIPCRIQEVKKRSYSFTCWLLSLAVS